jgi:hypothetical protein
MQHLCISEYPGATGRLCVMFSGDVVSRLPHKHYPTGMQYTIAAQRASSQKTARGHFFIQSRTCMTRHDVAMLFSGNGVSRLPQKDYPTGMRNTAAAKRASSLKTARGHFFIESNPRA